MRHNKTFKEGTEFEDVILWLQTVIKFQEVTIPGTHDTRVVIPDTFNISIMRASEDFKQLNNA